MCEPTCPDQRRVIYFEYFSMRPCQTACTPAAPNVTLFITVVASCECGCKAGSLRDAEDAWLAPPGGVPWRGRHAVRCGRLAADVRALKGALVLNLRMTLTRRWHSLFSDQSSTLKRCSKRWPFAGQDLRQPSDIMVLNKFCHKGRISEPQCCTGISGLL